MLLGKLAEALQQWKCAGCGGTGRYQQDAKGRARAEARGKSPDPRYQPDSVTCKVCNGGGLNPIASAALEIEPIGYLIEKSGIDNGYYFLKPSEYQHVEKRFRHIYIPVYAGAAPEKEIE